MIEFIWPFSLLFLFLPLLKRWFFKPLPAKDDSAITTPLFEEFKKIDAIRDDKGVVAGVVYNYRSWLLFLFAFIGWLLLVLALMRPVYLGEPILIEQEGRNLMLALDISGSMSFPFGARAGRERKIDVVKALSEQFVKDRKGDRVGVVVFASWAHLFVPLTFDVLTTAKMLEEVELGLAGSSTAIGDALAISLKSMNEVKSETGVIVLISDGGTNAGYLSVKGAIEAAKEMGIRIYTIEIGDVAQSALTVFGVQALSPRQQESGKGILQEISKETGGKYFEASGIQSLMHVYDEINAIEKIESDKMFFRPKRELFYYPLFLSLLFFFLTIVFKMRGA